MALHSLNLTQYAAMKLRLKSAKINYVTLILLLIKLPHRFATAHKIYLPVMYALRAAIFYCAPKVRLTAMRNSLTSLLKLMLMVQLFVFQMLLKLSTVFRKSLYLHDLTAVLLRWLMLIVPTKKTLSRLPNWCATTSKKSNLNCLQAQQSNIGMTTLII